MQKPQGSRDAAAAAQSTPARVAAALGECAQDSAATMLRAATLCTVGGWCCGFDAQAMRQQNLASSALQSNQRDGPDPELLQARRDAQDVADAAEGFMTVNAAVVQMRQACKGVA